MLFYQIGGKGAGQDSHLIALLLLDYARHTMFWDSSVGGRERKYCEQWVDWLCELAAEHHAIVTKTEFYLKHSFLNHSPPCPGKI